MSSVVAALRVRKVYDVNASYGSEMLLPYKSWVAL